MCTWYARTAKYDSPSACLTGNGGTPLLSENITHYNGDPADNSYPPGLLDGPFFSMKTAANLPVPHLLQQNRLAPYGEKPQTDQIYLRNYGERALMRGGAWYSQEFAGQCFLSESHRAAPQCHCRRTHSVDSAAQLIKTR